MAARAVDDHAESGDAAKRANPGHERRMICADGYSVAQQAVDAGEEQKEPRYDQEDAHRLGGQCAVSTRRTPGSFNT
jgi:hypothetical protein